MKRKWHLLLIPLFTFLFSLLIMHGRALGFNLGTFNPVRENVLRPIERAIPGLTLQGFIRNETKKLVHSRPNDGLNLPNVKYDFMKIEWLGELEGHYTWGKNVEMVGIVNFLYDSAYDWDHLFEKNFRKSEDALHYYRQGKRIVREFYFDFTYPTWNLRIGKQQVVWGRVLGARISDVINPLDGREGFDQSYRDDYEYARLPLWMINLKYFWGENNLQILWIPDFEPDLSAPPSSPWEMNQKPSSPVVRIDTRGTFRPDDFRFKDSQVAVRLGLNKGGWETHIGYFYAWSKKPIYFRESFYSRGRPTPFNPIVITLAPEPVRIHQIVGNVEKSFYFPSLDKGLDFKVEALYTINDYFGTVAEPSNRDQQVKKDWFVIATQFDVNTWVDWYWSLRIDNRFNLGWNHHLRYLPIGNRLDQWQPSWNFSLTKSFGDADRFNFLGWINDDLYDGDWWLRAGFSYDLTDYIILSLDCSFFWGNPDDLFGQMRRRDNIGFGIKYSF